jgi:hypothetical protein
VNVNAIVAELRRIFADPPAFARCGDNRSVTEQLPSSPTTPPSHGRVVLRAYADTDLHLAAELGADPYIPLIGSLPAHPTDQEALAWIRRQPGRLAEGVGLSLARSTLPKRPDTSRRA